MKALGWIIIGLIAFALMYFGLAGFLADNRAYPESDSIVFKNDSVIHKLWK